MEKFHKPALTFTLTDSEPEDTDITMHSTKNVLGNINSRKRTRKGKSGHLPPKQLKAANNHECSICLSAIREKRIGNPSGCKHNFCVSCIKRWAKNNFTCPLDRLSFGWINILDKISGNLLMKIDRDGRHIAVDEFTKSICSICSSSENPNLMICCDGCNTSNHVGCLPDPGSVSISSWLCTMCVGFPSNGLNEKVCRINAAARSLALQRHKIHLHVISMKNNKKSNNTTIREIETIATTSTVAEESIAHQPRETEPQDFLLEIMRSQDRLFRKRSSTQSSASDAQKPAITVPQVTTSSSSSSSLSSSSTVRLNNQSDRLSFIERLAKDILKPYFMNKTVTRDKATQILKIVVPKVCKETNVSTDQDLLRQIVQEKVLVWLDIL